MNIILLLDRSASMNVVRQKTIDGLNEYIENQQRDNPDARFTLITFDSESIDVVVDGKKMKKVRQLTQKDYEPRAMTPLYDAMGFTFNHIKKNVKKGRVFFVTMTDGLENFSQEFTREDIFKMVQKKKKKWTFVYLGANQDAFESGARMGLSNQMNYDVNNMRGAMTALSMATSNYSRTAEAVSTKVWKGVVDGDTIEDTGPSKN